MSSSARWFSPIGNPLQSPRFIDHALEQSPHGPIIKRTWIEPLHVVEHVGLTRGLVHLHAQFLLCAPDGQRAFRTRAEELHERFVELVDPLAERVDFVYSALFSHRTYSSTRAGKSGAGA